MKKDKNNILFIDKLVAGKDFACYFLDNNNLFLLNGKDEEKFSSFSFENKKKIKFDVVFIFSVIDAKQVDNLLKFITDKTLILTNNFQVCVILNANNIKNIFINLNLNSIFDANSKLSFLASEDINLENFSSMLEIKKQDNLIENQLSDLIINNAVNAICYLKDKNTTTLIWNINARNLIINLIEEQIKITNSVMLNVNNYLGFNYYKFLSGNNFLSSIKKHTELFVLLSNYKYNKINKQNLIFNIERILDLNYNKFVEIKYLQKVLNMLNNYV